MAEYRGRKARTARGRGPRREEPKGDTVTFALTVQLVVCVLVLLIAGIGKQVNEAEYSRVKRQYTAMVSETSGPSTAQWLASLTQGAQSALSALGRWADETVAFLLGKPQTEAEWQVPPQEVIPQEDSPESTEIPDRFGFAYLEPKQEGVTFTSLGMGGWFPISLGKKNTEKLSAPRGAVLSPIVLNSHVKPPVTGVITSAFAYRYHPITGTADFHTGIDIAAEEGRSILAALPGEVVEVGESAVYGKYIILQHATNLKTFYAHCSEILAREGMALRQGERIAKVGQTGTATGPHLHFSVIVDEQYTDPLWVLSDNLKLLE